MENKIYSKQELENLDQKFKASSLEQKKEATNTNNNVLPKHLSTTNLIILGMAGSGKTTFVEKLEEELALKEKESYIINLDPAVIDTFYEANLDIRDTVKYKQIMLSNNLGPNGAIMTCLNLFATNIDQIIKVLQQKSKLDYIVVDTPGQLEVFSWSASGKLISEALSANYPSILIYIVDVPRCQNPNTFVSNMMYAISIMYKMKLPLIIVFNKKDKCSEKQVFEWMSDYQKLQQSLFSKDEYISSFSQSLSLVLEEFYKAIKCVAVSSLSGDGFDNLIKVCEDTVSNYINELKDKN